MSDALDKQMVEFANTHRGDPAVQAAAFKAGRSAAKADLPDRETLAEAIFNHNAESIGSGVRFTTASERMKAASYEYADVVLPLLRGETKP